MEQAELNKLPEERAMPNRPEFAIPKPRKKRKWLRRLIIIALIAAAAAAGILRVMSASRQLTLGLYTQEAAALRDLTVSVRGTATVKPTDSYRVTALVTGEVLAAPFEVGDTVSKGDLLYAIESEGVENSIARAELAVRQAELNYNLLLENRADRMDNMEMRATASGVVQTLYIKKGDTVSPGTPVADILDRAVMKLTLPFHTSDAQSFYKGQSAAVTVAGSLETLQGTVDEISAVDEVGAGGVLVRSVTILVPNPGAITPALTGTATVADVSCAASGSFAYGAQETLLAKTSAKLSELYVAEGDTVRDGQTLGLFYSSDLNNQIENALLVLENARLSLDSTRSALDNYNITSPISGTVVEKNFKKGDNIEATTSGYLAVVYDMSVLTLTMNIDELDIGKIRHGQTVAITADALEGHTFTGHVDKVNINGATFSGVTTYPVSVIIDDAGDLLPGMNVSADIIVEQAEGLLCIPVDAVQRGNTVLIPDEGAYDQKGNLADPSKLRQVEVELGRSDADYIEVLSGLAEGDTVVIENQASSIYELMMGQHQGGGGRP